MKKITRQASRIIDVSADQKPSFWDKLIKINKIIISILLSIISISMIVGLIIVGKTIIEEIQANGLFG